MPEDLPVELRRFIAEHIGSIAQLELLLLLAGDAGKTLDSAEAARVFYLTPDAARTLLEVMRADGLVARQADGMYRFAPANDQWRQLVQALADAYHERRLSVVQAIYAGPSDAIQSFADAFRIKKDK
jgi:hypothetical protein